VLHHTTALAIPCTQKGYNLPRFVMGALFPTVRSSPGVSLLGTGGEPRRVERVLATVRIVVLLAPAYRRGLIKTLLTGAACIVVLLAEGGLGREWEKVELPANILLSRSLLVQFLALAADLSPPTSKPRPTAALTGFYRLSIAGL